MNRRTMIVMLAALELAALGLGYYFGSWKGLAVAALASVAAYFVRVQIVSMRRAGSPYPWWGLNALSFRTEINLTLGAVVDFGFAYLFILLFFAATHIRVPAALAIMLAILIGAAKYLWSTNLFRNHVDTFELGTVTFLDGIVPSGPDGNGLLPGYYWLPLGRPFYKIDFKLSTKEITVPFRQMKIWAANTPSHEQGAINGELDGNAQFEIINSAQYHGVENAPAVLDAIVQESARDVCERLTIEQFIETKNNELGADIIAQINTTLAARARPLGVRLNSVNVTRTDNKSDAVTAGWEEVSRQQSLATARATDAAGRIRRVKAYKKAGIDPNRAAALDAVASDKPGATVGDQRYNVDVGETLKGLGEAILNKFK